MSAAQDSSGSISAAISATRRIENTMIAPDKKNQSTALATGEEETRNHRVLVNILRWRWAALERPHQRISKVISPALHAS
ncbi:hypothetical protein GCM10027321_04100 [Massilia terrae]